MFLLTRRHASSDLHHVAVLKEDQQALRRLSYSTLGSAICLCVVDGEELRAHGQRLPEERKTSFNT